MSKISEIDKNFKKKSPELYESHCKYLETELSEDISDE